MRAVGRYNPGHVLPSGRSEVTKGKELVSLETSGVHDLMVPTGLNLKRISAELRGTAWRLPELTSTRGGRSSHGSSAASQIYPEV